VLFRTPNGSARAVSSACEARCSVPHEFIAVNRDEIIQRCRAKVATRSIPPSTEVAIDHDVPVFLERLR
jgi:hypothetical protein